MMLLLSLLDGAEFLGVPIFDSKDFWRLLLKTLFNLSIVLILARGIYYPLTKNKDYLFPSFYTIAGSGKNAAIVHYRANKNNTKIIENKDIFLCDSGGQYKYGTTDVTRTICFSKQSLNVKKRSLL